MTRDIFPEGHVPEFIDFPRPPLSRHPVSRKFLILIALVGVVVLFGRSAVSYYVDLLWFRSLGYDAVFWKTLGLQASTFAFFFVLTFFVLYGAFQGLRRAHRGELRNGHTILINGKPFKLPIGPALQIVSLAGSLLVAFITGLAMMSQWPTLALYWSSRQAPTSVVDPIFGRPLSFFLFTLPVWQLIAGWLLTLTLITSALALLFMLVAGGTSALNGGVRYAKASLRGVSLSVACLMAVLAAHVYLGRFELAFDHHTIFDGVTYTDAHVLLAGKLALCAALLLGTLLSALNAAVTSRGRNLAFAFVPAFICYVVVGMMGWYVGNFIVKPNELVREQPFIAHNIEMTRQAYGLDRFTQHEFPAETTVAATDPANNQPTLQNIRLWDWHALQDTLRQIQEIRTYYDFPDIDIDRYQMNGNLRQVMLAARELNVDKLPESSRNWINDRLIYTHGYGITMNPVNGFTAEGLPTLLLSNMPVQSTVPGLSVSRPEIYFGELTDTDVYVKTRQQEFNYPQGETNSLTSYEGTGGIVLGGFIRRMLLALDRGDIAKVPFSDDINSGSRLLMRRNVRARVAALAPFLTFDQDPYIVLGEDGRLSWIMDGFTTSDRYPDATTYELGDKSINYLRNSVKAVIDAYDGTTTFYVFDSEDPILAAYRNIFPSLFKDASAMPPGLHKHVRYPELLIKLQAEVYGLYHMTDPAVFYNREDMWTVATEIGMAGNGEQTTQSMQPNYVLMRLPDEKNIEFVAILPFTPANRNNLIGWIAARSDGAHYGSTVVYNFPKTRLIDGPLQIEARIDQNAQLSGQLTLWNQQGSHVRRGNLLVIPCGRALLYAEPIYLQAERSPMPELRIVVLALQDKLAYGPTYEAALSSLFGGSSPSVNAVESGPAPESAGLTPASELNVLIGQAASNFADYQRLTAAGKLGEAGQKLDALKIALNKLSAYKK